jgi:hypothetical protein
MRGSPFGNYLLRGVKHFKISNHNPLDLVERNLIVGAVIELGGYWAFLDGYLLAEFQGHHTWL